MKRIIFLILGLSILTASLSAGTPSKNFTTNNNIPEDYTCSLPAPTNLVLSNITSNSATGTWDAVSGASAYQVQVKRASNNVVVYSNVVAALTETATGLPASEHLVYEVSPICFGGVVSANKASKDFNTDIVIDLITSNYQQPCTGHTTTGEIIYGVEGSDEFKFNIQNQTQYYVTVSQNDGYNSNIANNFLVSYDGSMMQLLPYVSTIAVVPNASGFELGDVLGIEGNYYSFYGTWLFGYALVYNEAQGGEMLNYSLNGDVNTIASYATFNIKAKGPGWDGHGGRYFINVYECEPPSHGGGHEKGSVDGRSSDLRTETINSIAISPNPFTDQLTVRNDGTEDIADADIILTDISGKTVESYNAVTIPAGGKWTFNTGHLSDGMYLLKTQSAGKVKTQKVIKAGGNR